MKVVALSFVIVIVFHTFSTEAVSGTCSQKYYNSCKEALDLGESCSGVYSVKPDNLPPFEVYCDMENAGGGWTVFQRRMDGTVDFYLGWASYVKGFGDLNGEFWLGLSKINRLTYGGTTTSKSLRVDLADFDGNERYAMYSTFRVEDSSIKYKLTVAGYSGNAGDSFTYHNGQNFSTYDQDNDAFEDAGNCASLYKGAWWYKRCHNVNLNGMYLSGETVSYADGVVWRAWRGHHYSLKISEMKLR